MDVFALMNCYLKGCVSVDVDIFVRLRVSVSVQIDNLS